MLTYDQIIPFSVVNFEYYAAAIQGGAVRGAKVLGIFDATTAATFINPMLMHANVRPMLPAGAPVKYTDFMYVKLQLADGTITAAGLPWIRGESWEVVDVSSMRFTIDNVSPSGEQLILKALAANGFKAVAVEILK